VADLRRSRQRLARQPTDADRSARRFLVAGWRERCAPVCWPGPRRDRPNRATTAHPARREARHRHGGDGAEEAHAAIMNQPAGWFLLGGPKMARIELDHVTKRYPGREPAANDLSLDVPDGEFMILVGPSGSGKSTALRWSPGWRNRPPGDPDRRPGGQRPGAQGPRRRSGRPLRRAPAGGGDGPRDRPQPAGVPDGRALEQPGRQAAGLDPGAAGHAARAAGGHHHLRDPRPDRGDDPGHLGGGAQGRRAPWAASAWPRCAAEGRPGPRLARGPRTGRC
jgi:hypothetical protein